MLYVLAALALGSTVYFAVRGLRRLSRLPFSWAARLGLLNGSSLWDLLVGAGIGAIAIVAVVVALGATVSSRVTFARAPTICVWVLYFVIFAIIEEVVFRVLLVTGLRVVLSSNRTAICLGAILFGFGHVANSHAGVFSVLGSTIGGLAYGIAYVRSRALWLPLGMHLSWNVVQGTVFGLPVSGLKISGILHIALNGPALVTGGSYGLEGGQAGLVARAIVLALLASFLILRRQSLRGRPSLPLERGAI